MLVRIVKMSFHQNNIDDFLKNFDSIKEKIRNVDGCRLLELYQDKENSNVFFTYSYWDDEKDLNNYRSSKLFKTAWKQTKLLFNDKPHAWSVTKVHSLK